MSPVGVGSGAVVLGTMSDYISQGLKLAGNTGLSTTDAQDALNNFLQSEYRRKYPWQRKTITLTLSAGASSDSTDWDATFLDFYQQERDGSLGRYVIPGSTAPGYQAKFWAWTYREYIARPDRLTAVGPVRRIVGDSVGKLWYVWPVTDQGYTLSFDIYTLPAKSALGDTPLWAQFAPEEILVQVVKVWALDWMQDDRHAFERAVLFGDAKVNQPGMLPTYRRRVLAVEGITHQPALDPRVFPAMNGYTDDRWGDIWS